MTAEGIVQELITQTNITWSDELKELSVGELEGQPIKVGKEKYPEEYDIYTFEKKGKLKEWLENVLNSLPKS